VPGKAAADVADEAAVARRARGRAAAMSDRYFMRKLLEALPGFFFLHSLVALHFFRCHKIDGMLV
jgi:hypothetical protein